MKRPAQPVNLRVGQSPLDGHDIESAVGLAPQTHQVVARRQDDAPLFGMTHAGRRATVLRTGALTHLDKHHSTIGLAQDEVDLATTTAGRVKIALHEPQPLAHEVIQRELFGGIAALFGGGAPIHRLLLPAMGHSPYGHMALNPSLDLTLQAADALAGEQHYPSGALYVVATPIGNRADITLRALHVLQQVDAVACEDTRHTAALLKGYGIDRPLVAVHEHNEQAASVQLIHRLQSGQRIAYVSDAGTPGISDPGARLSHAVAAAGLRCIPIPGASSVAALVSVAGAMGGRHAAFEFTGFLPSKGSERALALRRLAEQPHACVVLEAPHRIRQLAQELQALGGRQVTVGRELTKQFEEVATMPCTDLAHWLVDHEHRQRGEFALLVHGRPSTALADELSADTQRILGLLLAELPVKTAARLCADITGASKNALYQAALTRRSGAD